MSLVLSIDIKSHFNVINIGDAVLDQRLRLSSQYGLIHHGRPREDQQVARHVLLLLDVGVAWLAFVSRDKDDITRVDLIRHDL